MSAGSWRDKVAHRIAAPRLLGADLRRIALQARRDFIHAYASYHQKRRTPGRVYSIPRRRCRMWLPIATGETVAQRRFGVFEPAIFELLEEIVRPGFVVIEIGACYGEFTIHLSRLVGAAGHVWSFELFPPYFAIAQRNVALNGLTNVRLLNRAAGRSGAGPVRVNRLAAHPYASLAQISRLDYSARVNPAAHWPSEECVDVETTSLADFVETERLAPDLVFMDIEGCELEVLHDLQPVLRGDGKRPLICLELHRAFYGDGGVHWLHTLFEQSGYGVRRVAEHLMCTPERAPQEPPVAPFV